MVETVGARPKRGRPPDPGKRKRLVDAASHLFLTFGVEAVTIEQIAGAAGVSRDTLYALFDDKAALLAAVVAERSRRIASDAWAADCLTKDLEVALVEFGDGLIGLVANPETFAFERLIEQIAITRPDEGRSYFEAGPARVVTLLEAIIRDGQAKGRLRAASAREAARDLMSLWCGFWRTEVRYGQGASPRLDEQRWLSRHGVNQFLRLYGAVSDAKCAET